MKYNNGLRGEDCDTGQGRFAWDVNHTNKQSYYLQVQLKPTYLSV